MILNYKIRRACAKDWKILRALPYSQFKFINQMKEDYITDAIVLFNGDELIGYIAFAHEIIFYMEIRHDYQNRALGSILFERYLKANKIIENKSHIEIEAVKESFGFWEKQGFEFMSYGHNHDVLPDDFDSWQMQFNHELYEKNKTAKLV